MKEFVEANYIEFVPKLKKDQALILEVQKLVDEMCILQKRVQDQVRRINFTVSLRIRTYLNRYSFFTPQIKIELSGSTRELKALSNDLQKSNISLALSGRLMDLSNCLQSAESFKKEKRYVEAAKTLQRMQKLLDDPNTDIQYLDIFRALKNEYSSTYGTFLTDVSTLWQQYIHWEIVDTESKASRVNLSVKCDVDEMQSLLEALNHTDNLTNNLHKFSGKLMKHFIVPIINYNCSVFVTNEVTFSVETLGDDKKPGYKNVLHNLTLLFKFLHQHLNVVVQRDERFLTKLETHLFQQFSDILINNCISHTIPSSSIELQNFDPVVQDISQFQNYLVEIGEAFKSL